MDIEKRFEELLSDLDEEEDKPAIERSMARARTLIPYLHHVYGRPAHLKGCCLTPESEVWLEWAIDETKLVLTINASGNIKGYLAVPPFEAYQ